VRGRPTPDCGRERLSGAHGSHSAHALPLHTLCTLLTVAWSLLLLLPTAYVTHSHSRSMCCLLLLLRAGRAAASALAQTFHSFISVDYAPTGCYAYSGSATSYQGLYLNTHAHGAASGSTDQ
jgi:hypothetical protein